MAGCQQPDYTDRHIVEDNPTYDEFETWYEARAVCRLEFFDGMLYKEMQLKDKLKTMVRKGTASPAFHERNARKAPADRGQDSV